MDWRIYYDDGSTFDSSQGEPEDAPGFGIALIVAQNSQVGRVLLQGFDFVYWNGTNWAGCDFFGLVDRLAHRLPTRAVSVGRMIETHIWGEIYERAKADPDFPRKSGKIPHEHPRGGNQKWRDV